MILVCADGKTQKSKIRNKRVQDLYEYQSTALEASSMTKEQFEANDVAGKRARKQLNKALKASGICEKIKLRNLWAIVDALSKMPEKITTQPITGALVPAGPSKRKHEPSHTEQRPSKKAKVSFEWTHRSASGIALCVHNRPKARKCHDGKCNRDNTYYKVRST